MGIFDARILSRIGIDTRRGSSTVEED